MKQPKSKLVLNPSGLFCIYIFYNFYKQMRNQPYLHTTATESKGCFPEENHELAPSSRIIGKVSESKRTKVAP